MAKLNLVFEHGQSPDAAREKFTAAIEELHSRFPGWVDRVDWADDGQMATLAGPGFQVRTWYDDRDLHIEGSVPLAWKLWERTIQSQISRQMHRPLAR
jgi:hypothetical protein